jgi:D-xylonolactonase
MAFSPDLQHFYWTDSTAKRIYRYRYDRATGEIADRTLFFQEAPDGGTPDGLVVDTNGNVWSARHRAGLILKHDQNDGRVLERIAFPTQRVTSMIFGGPERNILYVTTAGGGEPNSKNEDGALYQVTLNDSTVRGRDEFRSRVLLAG